jgi:hypothetical protein
LTGPSQRELAHLAQASNFMTRAAKEGALDFAQLHAGWADKLAGARLRGPRDPGPALISELELSQAAQKAVALAQQEKERLDPRGPDQVPGPGPAPHRPGPGCGRRSA